MNKRLALLLYFLGVALILAGFQAANRPAARIAYHSVAPPRPRLYLAPTNYHGISIDPELPIDAIPPLDHPKYEEVASAAKWLKDQDMVVGVVFGEDARAYPTRLLDWHEIVNETIGGRDVLVTYCPLCRSGVAFERRLDGKLLHFGNTGALFESGMVMYDQETKSIWSQPGGRAIVGRLAGVRLAVVPSVLTDWKSWRQGHPDTKVLSIETGYQRDYLRENEAIEDKYAPPARSVSQEDPRLPPRERIVGVVVKGIAKAYPVEWIENQTISDEIAGVKLEIVGDASGISATVFFVKEGRRQPAPMSSMYWFAWRLSYPDTLIMERSL